LKLITILMAFSESIKVANENAKHFKLNKIKKKHFDKIGRIK